MKHWTRTRESETPSAQHRRLSSASHARRAGIRERSSRYHKTLQISFLYFYFVNYPYLKKQASEEDSLKTQASNPHVLFFPVYPGDILRHVCKRGPVARQATPVFHR